MAVTPGVDFGKRAADYLRFSYATDIGAIGEALRRIEAVLASIERA